MKAIWKSFIRFIQGVFDDYMLAACLLTPILMGLLFRFGVPALENYLCNTYAQSEILSPYYLVFDLVICVMTPIMYAYAGVMTVLEEYDNGTARFLMVTPIGRSGYFISRIGIGSFIGTLFSIVTIVVLGLSHMSLLMNLCVSILCTLSSLIIAVFVLSYAKNKVEGIALIKLSIVIILGIPAVFFLPKPLLYVVAIFPSFWFTKMAESKNYWYSIPTLLVSLIYFILLFRKFNKRLV